MEKPFVCLANSRMHGGRCIAGKEFSNEVIGDLVRPVRAREEQALYESDCSFEDGTTAQLLDIVKVPLTKKKRHPIQKENYVIDEERDWGIIDEFSGDINSLLDSPDTLWTNGYPPCPTHGKNDRVPTNSITSPSQSLYFISPSNFEYVVQYERGREKVRADFEFKGVHHIISITDPDVDSMYRSTSEGRYKPLGKIYMTVSLGQDYGDYCYKLAAAVFEVDVVFGEKCAIIHRTNDTGNCRTIPKSLSKVVIS